MDDDTSTTGTLKRIAPGFAWLPRAMRDRLTPAALRSAITALAFAIAWVVNAQHDVHRLQESVAALEKDREQNAARTEVLHSIDTRLEVLANRVGDMATEVDRIREWRERIEDVAEAPPHARRHR